MLGRLMHKPLNRIPAKDFRTTVNYRSKFLVPTENAKKNQTPAEIHPIPHKIKDGAL